MNWSVLKDLKTMLGFITSILSGIIAIVLAVNNNDLWVLLVIVTLILMILSVFRADKMYRGRN
ncbi:hypothetical protein D8M04_04100 [Oceanobacillus piezotolerans]|uniref:Uncharacterized protein n=1 Tax=Oceanobacillus piezotolerans TaxID=2448030 RepID=A0A498DBQ0_9BACI|nr:hypothetical protein [Oceanobacillus piezotolerans]RLL48451.1 hypothetical protein D8M04_04100 [Oceanobacillus piezotolerans]